MTTQVIVLNGGSSSGKSGIVRCLKHLLPDPWISLGIDDLIERMPPAMVTFGAQGEIILGDGFDELQHAWRVGVAAMARPGRTSSSTRYSWAVVRPRIGPAGIWKV